MVAVLIDGIVASKCIGIDTYSGISLVGPFSSILLTVAGVISTGAMIVCSGFVGQGNKKEANEALNVSTMISIIASVLLIAACIIAPSYLLAACGVNTHKYPELNPHMYGYLNGFMIGIPALILIQVIGPIVVLDSGKKLFSVSSIVLCVTDIVADLLNVWVFKGGAFGMGLATSISYIVQLLFILAHFAKKDCFFRFSLTDMLKLNHIKALAKNGSPAFIKKIAGTLRDVMLNYINIMVAISAVAIAARGIQSDQFKFLFCIPTGLGRTLIAMAGVYFSANDKNSLKHLYSTSLKVGLAFSGIASVATFIFAPYLTMLYTNDPEVLSLAVFSIRWMSVALVFDTLIVLIQHFLQGTDNVKRANKLSFTERFIVPVTTAFVLGMIFGSKGILASVAISKIVLIIMLLVYQCRRLHRFPKKMTDIMFLPEDFGGAKSDNMYFKITSLEEAIHQSARTKEFCIEHGMSNRKANYMALFVEEMATNVINHSVEDDNDVVCINMRLFVSDEKKYVSMMDIGNRFDPTEFYKLHKDDSEFSHIGIRMVSRMADEMTYFNTFDSNNLLIGVT